MVLEQLLPYVLYRVAECSRHLPMMMFKDTNEQFQTWTYHDFLGHVSQFAWSLHQIGVKRGDHVFFFLDNCKEWVIADMALLSLGMVSVPRGTDVSDDDLSLFIEHSDSSVIIFGGESELKRLINLGLTQNRKLISVSPIAGEIKQEYNIYEFHELISLSDDAKLEDKEDFLFSEICQCQPQDIITITYTSGSTGVPKGVCLAHQSIVSQLKMVQKRITLQFQNEVALCILPLWHAYQRILHYIVLYIGSIVAFSKPVGSVMLQDIQEVQPSVIPGVPRLFESIYQGVHKKLKKQSKKSQALFQFFYILTSLYYDLYHFKINRYFSMIRIPLWIKYILNIPVTFALLILYPFQALGYYLIFRKINRLFGNKLRFLVSGGAHLPLYLDKFFRNIRLCVLEGYGMTEVAPLIALREYPQGIIGTPGRILGEGEYFLLNDKQERSTRKGELLVKLPNLMEGYYKNPTLTVESMQDGFLYTGDIVIVNHKGYMRIIGRTKNVVVLANGENVETEPIELKLSECPYIEYSLIVGQDEKFLGALISPNIQELENFAQENHIIFSSLEELCTNPVIKNLYRNYIKTHINKAKEFSSTPILDFVVLSKQFLINEELTTTLKVKRMYVQNLYFKEITSMYK